jgi:4-nitrophenyl phosphatase
LGMVTAGVLTGVSSRETFEQAPLPPAFVAAGLPELLYLFREADAD